MIEFSIWEFTKCFLSPKLVPPQKLAILEIWAAYLSIHYSEKQNKHSPPPSYTHAHAYSLHCYCKLCLSLLKRTPPCPPPNLETRKHPRTLKRKKKKKMSLSGILVSMGSVLAVCLKEEGANCKRRCSDRGQIAERVSGVAVKKIILIQVSSFPQVSWAEGKRSLLLVRSIVLFLVSSWEMQLRIGDVFHNTYPEREALVYLHDKVTYDTKTHQRSFFPLLPSL